jgi:hypothetical protein
MRAEPCEGRIAIDDVQELVLAKVVAHARLTRAGLETITVFQSGDAGGGC